MMSAFPTPLPVGSASSPTGPAGTAGIPPGTVRLLTEIGFLAAGRGRVREALLVLEGVRALRPGGAAAFVGMALAHMNAGEPAEAVRLLRGRALAEVGAGESGMVRAFLSLALKLDGRPRESAEAIDALAAEGGSDAAAMRLADAIRQSL